MFEDMGNNSFIKLESYIPLEIGVVTAESDFKVHVCTILRKFSHFCQAFALQVKSTFN
jgi:hypothetical protein